jgi:hypothetical protein
LPLTGPFYGPGVAGLGGVRKELKNPHLAYDCLGPMKKATRAVYDKEYALKEEEEQQEEQ